MVFREVPYKGAFMYKRGFAKPLYKGGFANILCRGEFANTLGALHIQRGLYKPL